MRERILGAVLLSFVIGGCAFGNKIDYVSQTPEIQIHTKKEIAVGVQDLRPYVISGEKSKEFVGLQRAAMGNPFGVHTMSGHALADDIANVIISALKKNNITARSIVLPSTQDKEQTLDALLKLDADKYLLVRYSEWKSDTYVNVALTYDISAQVYDKTGNLLAENRVNGEDDLGGSFMNPISFAGEAVPKAFREHTKTLLDHPDIAKALE